MGRWMVIGNSIREFLRMVGQLCILIGYVVTQICVQ